MDKPYKIFLWGIFIGFSLTCIFVLIAVVLVNDHWSKKERLWKQEQAVEQAPSTR